MVLLLSLGVSRLRFVTCNVNRRRGECVVLAACNVVKETVDDDDDDLSAAANMDNDDDCCCCCCCILCEVFKRGVDGANTKALDGNVDDKRRRRRRSTDSRVTRVPIMLLFTDAVRRSRPSGNLNTNKNCNDWKKIIMICWNDCQASRVCNSLWQDRCEFVRLSSSCC